MKVRKPQMETRIIEIGIKQRGFKSKAFCQSNSKTYITKIIEIRTRFSFQENLKSRK